MHRASHTMPDQEKKYKIHLFEYTSRAVGSFFMVRELSKMVGQQKKHTQMHWLKRPKAVPKSETWTKI